MRNLLHKKKKRYILLRIVLTFVLGISVIYISSQEGISELINSVFEEGLRMIFAR